MKPAAIYARVSSKKQKDDMAANAKILFMRQRKNKKLINLKYLNDI